MEVTKTKAVFGGSGFISIETQAVNVNARNHNEYFMALPKFYNRRVNGDFCQESTSEHHQLSPGLFDGITLQLLFECFAGEDWHLGDGSQ